MGKIKNADKELNCYMNIDIAFKHYNEVKNLIAESKEDNKVIRSDKENTERMIDMMKAAEKDLYDTRIAIVERVDELRKASGIKQNYLAKLLNSSEQNFSRIMNGGADFSIGQVVEISRIFKVSADFILFGENNTDLDEDVYEILKDKNYLQRKQAVKLLKVHFGMD